MGITTYTKHSGYGVEIGNHISQSQMPVYSSLMSHVTKQKCRNISMGYKHKHSSHCQRLKMSESLVEAYKEYIIRKLMNREDGKFFPKVHKLVS